MLMSAAQWNLRLENEYRAMCAFPINSLFSWKITAGQSTPRVKSYIITYHVKTMVKSRIGLKVQDKTEVLITMSDSWSNIKIHNSLRPRALGRAG